MKPLRPTLLTCVIYCMAVCTTFAVPATPRPFTYTQPDGTTIRLRVMGDERAHVYLTEDDHLVTFDDLGFARVGEKGDGLSLLRQRMHRQRNGRQHDWGSAGEPRRATARGEVRGLIILVDFSDLTFRNTQESISRQMNESGYADNGATGSARDYFISQSFGQFNPAFDVVGPVTLEFPYRYYGSNRNDEAGKDNAATEMIFTAAQKAHEEGLIDIGNYDSDHDGYADMVYVIYAGKGEADGGGPNTIWPHMSNIQSDAKYAFQTIGGKHLALYACSAECRGDGTFSGIGTFCHEYGHCLGLPDLYDVDYSGGFGMGTFDIMSGGAYNNKGNTPPCYSAYERCTLGWMTYTELETDQDIVLPPINDSRVAYRISTSRPDEYFTVENRQYQGWDLYLPSRGLMITHIDFDEDIWEANEVNDDPEHPRVMLMAADNIWTRTTENGDLYPGTFDNHVFNDTSTPSSQLWDGSPLYKSLTDIHLSGTDVAFHFHTSPDGIALPLRDMRAAASWYDIGGMVVSGGGERHPCKTYKTGKNNSKIIIK